MTGRFFCAEACRWVGAVTSLVSAIALTALAGSAIIAAILELASWVGWSAISAGMFLVGVGIFFIGQWIEPFVSKEVS